MTKPNIIKVVLLGTSGVGKSSLLYRYVTNGWDENIQTTLGAAFMDKQIQYKGRTLKFQIWDTAGQEKYAPLAQMYYRDADVAILVYDVTNKESFNNLKNWFIELSEKGPKDVILAVVGNKADLRDDERVSIDDAKAFAHDCKALYARTSAKENIGVTEMFNSICEELIKRRHIIEDELDPTRTRIRNNHKSRNKEGGCC